MMRRVAAPKYQKGQLMWGGTGLRKMRTKKPRRRKVGAVVLTLGSASSRIGRAVGHPLKC